jgi:hypothetical protein
MYVTHIFLNLILKTYAPLIIRGQKKNCQPDQNLLKYSSRKYILKNQLKHLENGTVKKSEKK